jgi:hypothetical protein
MAFDETHAAARPDLAQDDLRSGRSSGLRYRRAVTALSLAGMFSMAMVSLYHMGMLRHLPDPRIRRFHSDKVHASFTAHPLGIPDGAVAITSHALNIALAAVGGQGRARQLPWIPLVAAGKAAVEAVLAVRSLWYDMPVVERSWCGYRVVDALARLGILVLSLPEAAEAVHARPVPHT